MFDYLIKNANIADGTGDPVFFGGIAVKGDEIAEVFKGEVPENLKVAGEVLDAAGQYVTPGFVDVHRHGDLTAVISGRDCGEEIRQGITTFINGNCGFSAVPSSVKFFPELQGYAKPIIGNIPDFLSGKSFLDFFDSISGGNYYSNMGYLAGNGALRIAVKGFDAELLQDLERNLICRLLRDSLGAGVFGLSMGLMYVPENFYTEAELIELAEIAAAAKKIVTVHMRGEGGGLIPSIREVINIAKMSGAKFHISHLKAAGRKNWNRAVSKALGIIENARNDGADISFDVYPYTAGSTALYTLLPPDFQQGGIAGVLEQLRDSSKRRSVAEELRTDPPDWDNLVFGEGGWDSVVIAGRGSVAEIAAERGVSPEDCMFDLLLENDGNVPIVIHSMCAEDVESIIKTPGAIIVSDALYSESGTPHPRKFGAAAKFIAEYGGSIGFPQAVSMLTGLPAERFGIDRRGVLAAGNFADMLIIDKDNFRDTATYEAPESYPTGISAVFVNGKPAFRNGELQNRAGKILRK
ncbi:dihydroorotase [Clostridia bacterium]|nr:dihydroorotase [Clostridia bacterium]